jgi:hypothetical protein
MGYRGLDRKGGLGLKFKFRVVDEIGSLLDEIRKANLKNVKKAAGLVRTIARRSIRKGTKRKVSQPGEPPRYHGHSKTGIRMIWWDAVREQSLNPGAIVGPVKFQAAGEDVPHVLEFGGIAVNKKGQKYKLKARPYMRPAEEIARKQYPQFWADSV